MYINLCFKKDKNNLQDVRGNELNLNYKVVRYIFAL